MNSDYYRLPSTKIEKRERRLAVLVTLFPFLGFIGAIFYIFKFSIGLEEFFVFFVFYFFGELGAEVGHHRYFTHGSFKAKNPLKIFLAILASCTGKGSVFEFAAIHRRHHYYSDKNGDPHSPHRFGGGFLNALKGFCHSYYGWILTTPMSPSEHARIIDLIRDPVLQKWANKKMYYFWLTLSLVVPALVCWSITPNNFSLLKGFLWGGLIRVFFEQHSAYAINSVCHLFGSRPFKTNDSSTNNTILALLTFGVGWHNNHHAFPYTAYNQFEWWQIDLCGWFIKLMKFFGLVYDDQFPTLAERNAKKQL